MCDECEAQVYEVFECCASGSCEVCSGLQGRIRASVRRSNHSRPEGDDR